MKKEIIIKVIEDVAEIKFEAWKQNNKIAELVKCRQYFAYYMRKYNNTSMKNIGKILSGRKYCTIITSLKALNSMIFTKWQPYYDNFIEIGKVLEKYNRKIIYKTYNYCEF